MTFGERKLVVVFDQRQILGQGVLHLLKARRHQTSRQQVDTHPFLINSQWAVSEPGMFILTLVVKLFRYRPFHPGNFQWQCAARAASETPVQKTGEIGMSIR
mmetsp:Transcript_27481/g.72561  ORF Transcript_27481/g.72561 Transcript_27481/m.72561 type:complete len:102 (+) Transcript_27481:95-400(+)